MHFKPFVLSASLAFVLFFTFSAPAQEMPPYPESNREVATYKPDYIPPSEILGFLGVRSIGNLGILQWETPDGKHAVDIRHNDAANIIIVSGEGLDVDHVMALIGEADIPPRQIEIEVKIIEVNNSRSKNIGIDWERLITRSLPTGNWRYREEWRDDKDIDWYPDHESYRDGEYEVITRYFDASSTIRLSDVVRLLDETGLGTARTAPRILTLNNRRATILDGERVTYVTRYASYTNLFETDSMDAGITVSVLPSIGESGYITLKINAEMTSLGGEISGSPVKKGQLIENTVIVKDGESVLLGGLTRSVELKGKKRFPILGHILPFIFSQETSALEEIESYMILTPRVVDFSTALDERIKTLDENPGGEPGK